MTIDFHGKELDDLKSKISCDSSIWLDAKGIVIASLAGSLGQSVSKKYYKKLV